MKFKNPPLASPHFFLKIDIFPPEFEQPKIGYPIEKGGEKTMLIQSRER